MKIKKYILNIFKDIPSLYFFLRSILLLLLFLSFLPRIFKCCLSFSLSIINYFGKELQKCKKIIPVIIYIVSVCYLSFYSSIRKIFLTTYSMLNTVLDSRDTTVRGTMVCAFLELPV